MAILNGGGMEKDSRGINNQMAQIEEGIGHLHSAVRDMNSRLERIMVPSAPGKDGPGGTNPSAPMSPLEQELGGFNAGIRSATAMLADSLARLQL